MVLRFFGQTHSIREISLEYQYILIKEIGVNYSDAYNMPLWKRKWFIEKLIENNKQTEEIRQRSSAAQNNSNNSSRRLFGNNN